VLRKILGPERDWVTWVRRRLHNDGLHDLYFWPNVVRMIKSKRIRWVGLVACVGDRRSARMVLVGKTRERDILEDLGVDGRILLKWIFRKYVGASWAGLIWLSRGTCGELLWTRYWSFGFLKMRGSYCLDDKLLASREALCCTEFRKLVSVHHVWCPVSHG